MNRNEKIKLFLVIMSSNEVSMSILIESLTLASCAWALELLTSLIYDHRCSD